MKHASLRNNFLTILEEFAGQLCTRPGLGRPQTGPAATLANQLQAADGHSASRPTKLLQEKRDESSDCFE